MENNVLVKNETTINLAQFNNASSIKMLKIFFYASMVLLLFIELGLFLKGDLNSSNFIMLIIFSGVMGAGLHFLFNIIFVEKIVVLSPEKIELMTKKGKIIKSYKRSEIIRINAIRKSPITHLFSAIPFSEMKEFSRANGHSFINIDSANADTTKSKLGINNKNSIAFEFSPAGKNFILQHYADLIE